MGDLFKVTGAKNHNGIAQHACYGVLFMWAEVRCWSTVEVCNMLRSIGLSQYEENFTKSNIEGKELLTMQKQDFIVSTMGKCCL